MSGAEVEYAKVCPHRYKIYRIYSYSVEAQEIKVVVIETPTQTLDFTPAIFASGKSSGWQPQYFTLNCCDAEASSPGAARTFKWRYMSRHDGVSDRRAETRHRERHGLYRIFIWGTGRPSFR